MNPMLNVATSQAVQVGGEILFGAVALIALGYCIRVARRQRKLWPLYLYAGSALNFLYEPFNNLLGHCAYPVIGQHTLITVFDQHIPIYIGLVYIFYFSLPVPLLVQRWEAGITKRQFWKDYIVLAVLVAAFEPMFIKFGWWLYHGGNQALAFTGFPMWWWFANPMCVFAVAAMVFLLRRYVFTSNRQAVLIVPLVPLTLFASHASAATPVFVAINQTTGDGWTTAASIVTIGISLLYVWIISKAVISTARPTPEPTDVTEHSGRVHSMT
ncbi:hypothetical protein [Mycolicibacterium hodleri]|uniref:hypothetical protein n=1 Tax=Mycolicibacterium hodleri TaxID=49897 RepID=UPI001126F880|nr:hypothetical protein [Mycolicibacterium hodleri]